MTSVNSDLEEMVADLFANKVTHADVIEAERVALLDSLWATVAELDLGSVGIPEESGGAGGTFVDIATILFAAGQHAAPLPLLDNYLARRVATSAGVDVRGAQHWSIAPGTPKDSLVYANGQVSGTVHAVAWGGSAARVVAYVDGQIVVLDPTLATVTHARDIAGQPSDTLTFDGVAAQIHETPFGVEALRIEGGLLRAAQMAGAMEAIAELSRVYASQRVQFGKPIGSFQAVQTHLVYLAEAATLLRVSVERAAALVAEEKDASFASGAAKLLANQYAAISIKSGHQVHGAIGMTQEYSLQDYTRRLNAWRADWGSEFEVADRLGAAVASVPVLARVAIDEGAVIA